MMSGSSRVIVEVRFGPMASRKAILEPGGALRVGRIDKADLTIPHDEHMSGVHFQILWDGHTCEVADLDSATGTFLAGERVTGGKVVNGDWIRAGSTDFVVSFEGHTKPRPEQISWLPQAVREQALRELEDATSRSPLFAVIDAARSERALVVLRESVEEHRSLYDGVTAETLADAAPYLVELRGGSRLLSTLVLEGWGDAWGVYFSCRRSLKDVRAHLRKLLMVTREEENDVVYFRFYDPRVLPIVLPTCTVRQEAEIFGEIEQFYCEDELGGVLRIGRGQQKKDASA
jgi:hypothetical protein